MRGGMRPGPPFTAGRRPPDVALLLEPLQPVVEALLVVLDRLRRAGELDVVDLPGPLEVDGEHAVVRAGLRLGARVERRRVEQVRPLDVQELRLAAADLD